MALIAAGAQAADKASTKPRATKASAVVDFTKDGDPIVHSSSVLVLDPATGQTLDSKNADHVGPIASITKLMTAMVGLDAKLDMEESLHITGDDIDLVKNTSSRLPLGSHFRRDDLMPLALMASDNRAASALGRNYPGGLPA